MDNAQKAIMIGVGLFITILIISAVMLIVTSAVNMINNASSNLGNLEATLQESLTRQYDGTSLTGTQVISAVSTYYSYDDMILEVQALDGGTVVDYGAIRGNGTVSVSKGLSYDSSNTRGTISMLSDSSNSDTYVPVNARFKSELIKNGDAVVGILFVRQ